MKSLTKLWRVALDELGAMVCVKSTAFDKNTAEGRSKCEGLSFYTITLPSYCKEFERALEVGTVDPASFQSFRKRGSLPLFLGGFLDLIFDRESGSLLDEPSVDAIYAVRQITLMFSKILLPTTQRRDRKAIDGFIECEQSLDKVEAGWNYSNLADFKRASILLFGDPLTVVDHKVFNLDLLPKHGPGQTADKLQGNAKYRQLEWTERLEEVLPAGEFLLANWRHSDVYDRVKWLEPGSERPVRVTLVPKTMKTPRIIAIEPTCMQYAQQAIAVPLVEALEEDNLSSIFVGFTDQAPNQRLARNGSRFGDLATLDLSEASDRVHNRLVQIMLSNHPHLADAVQASRSTRADVPFEKGIIPLRKFASMGSALCFPVEAMVFASIVFLGISRALNEPMSRKLINKLAGHVRVYGDDIVVPADCAEVVITTLESFGMKVNVNKSFWKGKFRESCGKEYYAGYDVSIVKVRRVFPTSRRDGEEVLSLVSLRNQLYQAGLWSTTMYVDEMVRKLRLPFPHVLATSPVNGRHSVLPLQEVAYCVKTQRPLVFGLVNREKPPKNLAEDHAALMKTLLLLEARNSEGFWLDALPSIDEEHLSRSGRSRSVILKSGWAPAF